MQSITNGRFTAVRPLMGPAALIFVFFAAAVCVGFFLPQTIQIRTMDSSLRTQKTWLAQNGENHGTDAPLTAGKPLEYAVKPVNIHSQITDNANRKDSGLDMYRQLISRSAVISFYEKVTGNRDVTLAILEYADVYNIPLSLAFSLAFTESRYKINAVNGNTNASIDRGLFQLNSESFPGFSEDDFFNPYVSAKQGLAFLRYCLDTGGNEIAALAMYNAGTRRVRNNGTPHMTLNYISNIMTYQRGLENMFDTKVAATFRTRDNKALALAGRTE
ncbi:transglycosylase SLT domain-containing protein [Treponema lecithinolyticum]